MPKYTRTPEYVSAIKVPAYPNNTQIAIEEIIAWVKNVADEANETGVISVSVNPQTGLITIYSEEDTQTIVYLDTMLVAHKPAGSNYTYIVTVTQENFDAEYISVEDLCEQLNKQFIV